MSQQSIEHRSIKSATALSPAPAAGAIQGGKALGLARLDKFLANYAASNSRFADIRVPRWTNIPADIFLKFCSENGIKLSSPADEVHAQISAGTISGEIRKYLTSILKESDLFDRAVAIRSNSAYEDSSELSFAGMFLSMMPVTAENIFQAIKDCWAGYYSARVETYLKTKGRDLAGSEVGLIIQEYIEASRSGVVFSRWPSKRGDYNDLIIEAVYGMGEGLVGGYVDADRFRASSTLKEWTCEMAATRSRMVATDNGQNMIVTVGGTPKPVLSEDECADIAEFARSIEASAQYAVDIEFCLKGETLYVLQERAITTLPSLDILKTEFSQSTVIWDNSNIAESFPGLTLPLTFSHIRRAYAEVYEQFANSMGVPKSYVAMNQPVFLNMLGLIRGRVYYNLLNWYRLIYLLPNAHNSKSFMEGMMGVSKSLEDDPEAFNALFAGVKRPQGLLYKVRAAFCATYELLSINRSIRHYQNLMNVHVTPKLDTNFNQLSLSELMRVYEGLCDDLLKNWKAPVVNDTRCMIYSGLLRRAVGAYLGDDLADDACNHLIHGRNGLFSEKFVAEISAVADDLRSGAISGASLFNDNVPTWDSIKSLGDQRLHERLVSYIKEYGYRCGRELNFETQDLTDKPELALAQLANALKAPHRSKRDTSDKLTSEMAKLSIFRRWLLRNLAQKASSAIDTREDLRYWRTKSFVVAKRIFRAMGKKMAELNILDHENDVFYLSVEDLRQFITGGNNSRPLRHLVDHTKREYENYSSRPAPPDRFVTKGAVGVYCAYDNLLDEQKQDPQTIDSRLGKLKGIACSPGLAQGKAYVAHSAEEALKSAGSILICERTDPGWVRAFASCNGLVVEYGSLLSHAAIVAREMGIPTVIGVRGASKAIQTGDAISLNGSSGDVYFGEFAIQSADQIM
jgi:rifampicin phosphotransferase